MATWDTVERVDRITEETFYREYVAEHRPVIIDGMMTDWLALGWGFERFRGYDSSVNLLAKKGNIADGVQEQVTLADYAEVLGTYEKKLANGLSKVGTAESPGYLHDVPLFHFFPELVSEVEPFPADLLPRWYRDNWPRYVQCFIGPTGSATPLHFDTLLTNNLFFHLAGQKQFTLIPASQRSLCYMNGWRWAQFDPTAPNYAAFPRAVEITPLTLVLQPGEILYMPPGTLHHVHNLTMTMSFNIDWHTTRSALGGVVSVLHGAPLRNDYYNLLSLIGLGIGVPEACVFPFYKSYLTYIS